MEATSFDLEERTLTFSKQVIKFINLMPKNLSNVELAKQLIRSAGSVGANYVEANESFSKKDFLYRIKLCRKEAKESNYWLKLIEFEQKEELMQLQEELLQESMELTKIFGSIVYRIDA